MTTTGNMLQTVPAHIAARIAARKNTEHERSATADAILGDGGMFAYPRISIRAGRFRLVEDGVETPVGIVLGVVIIGANPRTSKVFYSRPYDGSENVRPDCFSNDGIKPDLSVASPVNANCLDCPHNVLGSKILPSGAKSKTCADQRHLAVIPAADPNKVYGFTIPVSAMKALRDYFKDLNNYGVNPEEVITELGFDEQASFPKVTFTHKGYVPERSIAQIEALQATDDVKIVTRTIATQARLGAPPAPVAVAAPVTPPVAVAPPAAPPVPVAVAPAPVPPVQAPAPRGRRATAAAAPAAEAQVVEKAAPMSTSDELAAKLDSIFGDS